MFSVLVLHSRTGHGYAVTQPIAHGLLQTVAGADAWELLPDDRIKISVTLERNDARVVYVLGEKQPRPPALEPNLTLKAAISHQACSSGLLLTVKVQPRTERCYEREQF